MGLIGKFASLLLEWGARAAAALALLYSIYQIVAQNFWISPLGDVSPFSLGAASVLFILSQYQFSRGDRSKVDSVVLGVLFANAFLQIYEITYHFTFPIYSLQFPFIHGSDLRFLIVELVMVIPLLLVRKELTIRRASVYVLGAFILSMVGWALFGFPQYFSSVYYLPRILHTDDPYHLALAFNYGSKVILAGFFVTILKLWHRGPTPVWGRKLKGAQPQPAPSSA